MKKEKSRGQSVVELALILPIVILILLGLIEFGRALFIYTVVSNAAREGARFGIVFPRDHDGIRNATESRLMLVPTDTVTINISYDLCNDPCNGDGSNAIEGQSRVIVNVQADFSMVTPIIRDLFPQTTIEFTSARTIVFGARARKTPVVPPPPACDVPLTGVTISGPTEGEVDEDLTFTANVQPANATPPITYVWSTANLVSGQGTANATYRWNLPGDYQINVTAQNCGGTPHTDYHEVRINPPAGSQLIVTYLTNYPARGTDKPPGDRGRIRVKVRVTNELGDPISDAVVTVDVELPGTLTYLGDGYYGGPADCWVSADDKYEDRDVTVTATKDFYDPGSVTANTEPNPHGETCP